MSIRACMLLAVTGLAICCAHASRSDTLRRQSAEAYVVKSNRLVRISVQTGRQIGAPVPLPSKFPWMPSSRVSLDGRYVALTLGDEDWGKCLYVFDSRMRRWQVVDEGRCTCLQFSKDGRWIAYCHQPDLRSVETYRVCRLRPKGDPVQVSGDVQRLIGAMWAPASHRFLVTEVSSKAMTVYDAETGKKSTLPPRDRLQSAGPAYAELARWAEKTPFEIRSMGWVPDVSPDGRSAVFGIVAGGPQPMVTEEGQFDGGSYWESPTSYLFYFRGKSFTWKPREDFDLDGLTVQAWSPSGSKALFHFEAGFAIHDFRTRKTQYFRYKLDQTRCVIGGVLKD